MSEAKMTRGPLATKIADLSKCTVDVGGQSKSLQSSLQMLLQMHTEREQMYAEAVKYVQDNYDDIIQEAQFEADLLIVTATSKAHKIVATAKEETEAWTMEKAKLAMVQQFQPKIKLDVGGSKFTTSLTTLRRFPDTMIGAMFSGRHALPLDEEGYHFVDRDGTHFRYILNFLRSPETFELDLAGSALKELKSECDYYGIVDLMFPFTPIAAFSCANPANQTVTVSQDQNGVWSVNSVALKICAHCFRADYSHCGVKNHQVSYSHLSNFNASVQTKGGIINTSTQPKPTSTCGGCGRM